MEDPLKLPDTDDNNILSLFNNNERAKDLGFHTSDSEFISLDRLEDRNRGAMVSVAELFNSITYLLYLFYLGHLNIEHWYIYYLR